MVTLKTSQAQPHPLSRPELKRKFQVTNFDPNAFLRGFQLTVVGALRAFQNPNLFTSEHYRQAAIAVGAGILIRFAIAIPVIGIKVLLWFLSFFVNFASAHWVEQLVNGLDFVQNYVLQVPLFLMTLMRYVVPTLDQLFLESLRWVDTTYYAKHKDEDSSDLRQGYYPNLKAYPVRDGSTNSTSTAEAISMFLFRYGKKAGISLLVFALSYVPIVGRFVLPAASFYTFNRFAGPGPAAIVFGTGVFLPRKYLVVFLQTYFSSRSMMRELLEPYFSRIHFTTSQKRDWFRSREGLLFGFGVGFYIFLRIPLLGVLIYGIAEASTAYLITKITDPPPHPGASTGEFVSSQLEWRNRHAFLSLSLSEIDRHVHSLSELGNKEEDHKDGRGDGKAT